jgi:hypothetical protein
MKKYKIAQLTMYRSNHYPTNKTKFGAGQHKTPTDVVAKQCAM